jgi:hypothetical protein
LLTSENVFPYRKAHDDIVMQLLCNIGTFTLSRLLDETAGSLASGRTFVGSKDTKVNPM